MLGHNVLIWTNSIDTKYNVKQFVLCKVVYT